MFSPDIHAMLIQAHVEDLIRRARKFNERHLLREAYVATARRSSFLDRASKRLQGRSIPKEQAFGMTGSVAVRKRSA